jgi:hypothetical protein
MQRLKAWLPAVVWMGVIFIMSAMPGEQSADQSGTLVTLVLWLVQTARVVRRTRVKQTISEIF